MSAKVTECARAARQAMTFVVSHCLHATLVCIVCGFALLGCNTPLWTRGKSQHTSNGGIRSQHTSNGHTSNGGINEQWWYHMTQLLRLDSSQVVRQRTLATLGDIAALRHVSGRAAPAHLVTFAQKQNFASRAPQTECLMDLEVGGRRF